MKQLHILIVDDEPNIVMSLEFLLRKNGYHVSIARNGPEALDAINQTAFDVILLNSMMPDVDGYQVCRHVRTRPDCQSTKVVFLSAESREVNEQQGADLYIPKPFSPRQLVRKVQELVAATDPG